MVIKQADIIAKIAEDKQLSKAKAKQEWAYFVGLVKEYLDGGDSVKLPEIGILRRELKEAHLSSAPGKTEKVQVPAKYFYKLKTKKVLA